MRILRVGDVMSTRVATRPRGRHGRPRNRDARGPAGGDGGHRRSCRLVRLVPGVVDVVYRATADAAASTGTDCREGA
jgi:hypothetical protein